MTKIKAALALAAIIGTVSAAVMLRPVFAASSMTIAPATVTQERNAEQTFTVSVNTDGTEVFGADAVVSYPPTAFDFVSASNGNFFTDFGHSADTTTGTLSLHGYFSSIYQYKSGTGTLATFKLRAKNGSGTATVSFVCGGAATSQIISAAGSNILSCNSLNQSTVTFTGATISPTPSPTPTTPPGVTPSATPTRAPGTPTPTPTGNPGNREPVCAALSANPQTGAKPLTVTFTCTGSDADNDITAAEFSFGDTKTRLVERNVGQNGSLTTSYIYRETGTYLTSCRIRDNNGWYSSVPASCQKSVVVTATRVNPTPTGTRGRTPTPTAYQGNTGFDRVTLTNYATPTPTGVAEASPSPTPSARAGISDRLMAVIKMVAVSAVVIAIAFFLQRKFD